MSSRENLEFETTIESDSAALHTLVADMVAAVPDIHCLRDPTRGGLGTTLNEIAQQSQVGLRIQESRLLIKPEVAGVCELLGFDPLYLANEGKLLAFVSPDCVDAVLKVIRTDPCGKDAAVIGEVVKDYPGKVFMKTRIGGTRIVDMLAGEQLPRIC